MSRFVIARTLRDVGDKTVAVHRKRAVAGDAAPPQRDVALQWIASHVIGDTLYSIYQAAPAHRRDEAARGDGLSRWPLSAEVGSPDDTSAIG